MPINIIEESTFGLTVVPRELESSDSVEVQMYIGLLKITNYGRWNHSCDVLNSVQIGSLEI